MCDIFGADLNCYISHMNTLNIVQISRQPVKKEYKAPFNVNALVYGDLVGFCLHDFSLQIVDKYKKMGTSNTSPEYKFAKFISTVAGYKYRHQGRKFAFELMLLMNAAYRPWYVCDEDPVAVELFEVLSIDLNSPAYSAFKNTISNAISHPYLAIVFQQFSSTRSGIKSFFNLDALNLAKNIRTLLDRNAYYRLCVEKQLFDRDKLLMQLYEFTVEALDGHYYTTYRNMVDLLTKDLSKNIQAKSQLLLFKSYSLSANVSCYRSTLGEFTKAQNYSLKNDYKVPYYRVVAELSANESQWELFDTHVDLLSSIVGDDDPGVKNLRRVSIDKRKSESTLNIEEEYLKDLHSGLMVTKSVGDYSIVKDLDFYRSYHSFAPNYIVENSLANITTENLINLTALLNGLKAENIEGLRLNRKVILGMYPDEQVAWGAISDLISSRVIKLNLKMFELIPIRSLNNIDSYHGMKFKINIEEIKFDNDLTLRVLKGEIDSRKNRTQAMVAVWRKLTESYFYAQFANMNYTKNGFEFLKNFEISTEIKIKIRKLCLSASKLCSIADQSVKGTVLAREKKNAQYLSRGRQVTSTNIIRYLNVVMQGGTITLPYVERNLNTYSIETAMLQLTGIQPHELYNLSPKESHVEKIQENSFVV